MNLEGLRALPGFRVSEGERLVASWETEEGRRVCQSWRPYYVHGHPDGYGDEGRSSLIVGGWEIERPILLSGFREVDELAKLAHRSPPP